MCKARRRRVLIPLAVLLAAGCAPLKVTQKPAAPARRAMQAGRYAEAAHLYLQLAGRATNPKKQHYLVSAAAAAEQAGENKLAQHTLSRLFPSLLRAGDRTRADLVQARLYLARNQPAAALKRLPPPRQGVARDLAEQVLKLRGRTLFKLNRPVQASQALTRRAPGLTRSQARANNTMIWKGLQSSNLPPKNAPAVARANSTVRGWVALARIERQSWGTSEALRRALNRWRNNHPGHPATETIAPRVLARYKQLGHYPERIALLLPLTGHLQTPAQAIRDGFLAGRFDSAGKAQSTIALYDTGPDAESALNAYHEAVRDGAQIIVGPLSKDAVTAVAAVAKRSPPELTLNYPRKSKLKQLPPGFYRLGLSPDDEARAVAALANRAGLHRAVTLAPDNQWGRNAVAAFKKSLKRRGGAVVDSAYFQAGTSDFSEVIQQMLGLGASQARHKALVAALRRRLHFQPEPRDDVDFIFLAAQPREARLIRPQLKFLHAGGIPVYATSSVYSGTPAPDADQDENGITFCDTPWTLSDNKGVTKPRNAIRQLWPRAFSHYPRLFALGWDAYRLIPPANAHALAPNKHFQGFTGSLYNNGNGRILRDLQCARFAGGRAVSTGNRGAGVSP